MAQNDIDFSGITPSPGYYIVIPEEHGQEGFITISDRAQFQEQIGKVVAVGDDEPFTQNPEMMHTAFAKVGDRIYHKTWQAQPVQYKNIKIRFIPFADLLGVIND